MLAVLLFYISCSANILAIEPPITAVAFAPDGKSIVAVSQSGLHVFNWPDLIRKKTVSTSAANLHAVAFSPTGEQVAVGGGNPAQDGSVEVFSWPAAKLMTTARDHSDSVTSVVWQDETRLLSASLDRNINLHDIAEGKTIRRFSGHSRGVTSLCLLRDGKTLVSAGDDQSMRVWNVSTGELIRSMSQHTKPIRAVSLRPTADGLPMVASASEDRTVRFWQPTIGRMVRFARLDAEPLDIAWTTDGKQILASCVDGKMRVIDPLEVTVTRTVPTVTDWAYAIAVHPTDGHVVVAGAGGQLLRVEGRLLKTAN